MGEVYRARDMRLERTVAIKILPQQLSDDPIRKQRFEREAYKPKLGMAAGGGTLVFAAIFKKGWAWWVLGIFILVLALLFYWNKQNEKGSQLGIAKENF